jgi:hypothetical protein
MFSSLKELRDRAWKDIESARHLLASDPDRAAYLAGYAIELLLKGKYADAQSWTDYPDLAEIRKRGGKQLIQHDLDELVSLAKAEGLRTGGMLDINWDVIRNWNVSQRYTPVGTLRSVDVEIQLQETEKAYHQIVDYMVLDKLVLIETTLTGEYGLFNLFAFVENVHTAGWELWYSAWARPNGPTLLTDHVETRLNTALDEDLREAIGRVQAFHPDAPVVRSFNRMTGFMTNVLHGRVLLKECIDGSFGRLPNAYVITSGRWAPATLEQAWRQIP